MVIEPVRYGRDGRDENCDRTAVGNYGGEGMHGMGVAAVFGAVCHDGVGTDCGGVGGDEGLRWDIGGEFRGLSVLDESYVY